MTKSSRLVAALLSAAAAAAVSCAGTTSEDLDDEGGQMTLTSACKETACKRKRDECLDRVDSRCNDCYELCLEAAMEEGDGPCFDSCDRSCDPGACFADSCDDLLACIDEWSKAAFGLP